MINRPTCCLPNPAGMQLAEPPLLTEPVPPVKIGEQIGSSRRAPMVGDKGRW